jgi:hypothetical protein
MQHVTDALLPRQPRQDPSDTLSHDASPPVSSSANDARHSSAPAEAKVTTPARHGRETGHDLWDPCYAL